MAVAEVLAHHRAILAFDQGVIVGASGAGFGEFLDAQLLQEGGDLAVDVFRSVVGVKAEDGEPFDA
jgi:hypothetical protein